ncbi:MAG: glycosyltransferase family 2 protein [Thermoanaerobaculia bacterium]
MLAFQPTILIPAYGRVELTRRALASLRDAGAERVLLIDDDGRAEGSALAREFPGLEVLTTDAPVFWTGAIACGVERARDRGDAGVLFFNQDVVAPRDYLERLAQSVAANPGALVGSALLYAQEPDRVWSGGGGVEWFGRGMRILHHGAPVSSLPAAPYAVDWLFGMGTYVPMEVFAKIGLPDGERFPMSWGDTDFSLRAHRAGIPLRVDPHARLLHEVGVYDARAAGHPSLRQYLSWMGDPKHNLSLSAHAEIWRRHGPRGLWPLSLALRFAFLAANFLRIRFLFPTPMKAGKLV